MKARNSEEADILDQISKIDANNPKQVEKLKTKSYSVILNQRIVTFILNPQAQSVWRNGSLRTSLRLELLHKLVLTAFEQLLFELGNVFSAYGFDFAIGASGSGPRIGYRESIEIALER